MIIANPIYDVVFKRLMENEMVAKFFISTLLDQTVEAVEVKPQEFTYTDKLAGLAVFRLDFIATIKTEEGYKKILIEIQKARNQIDLMRFRNYLAEQYKKEDTINNEKIILPITTIYILGFPLPEIDSPCIKVERNYKDLINNKIITAKSDFVEKLSHDSYIVQVERITGKYQTRLDKLLSVFEQTNFVDNTRITKQFKHETDIEEVKTITDILHYTGTDPEEKKKIETEQEAWRTVNAMFEQTKKELMQIIDESKKEIDKSKRVIDESKKEIDENKKVIDENKKVIDESKKEIDEKDRLIEELKRRLGEE